MIDRDRELRLLFRLRGSLADLGLGVQLHEGLPGLMVATEIAGLHVWVFVSDSGRAFTWRRADSKHSVDDLPGAAGEIARFVTAQSGRLNGSAPDGEC